VATAITNTIHKSTMRVIVVGAGMFGISSAIELQRRGHDVILIDECAGTPHPLAASTDISKIVRGGKEGAVRREFYD
jgi:sarcosine oxidase/L-pipecolate oxidase